MVIEIDELTSETVAYQCFTKKTMRRRLAKLGHRMVPTVTAQRMSEVIDIVLARMRRYGRFYLEPFDTSAAK